MRMDVRIGLVASLVVVALAGWYFLGRADVDTAIPIGEPERASSQTPSNSGEPPYLASRDRPDRVRPWDASAPPDTDERRQGTRGL